MWPLGYMSHMLPTPRINKAITFRHPKVLTLCLLMYEPGNIDTFSILFLTAMYSFVLHCPELVTEDVTRRLLPPLECALTMNAQ